jgi:L-ascorbate metabolism protein UlaG (beta-lactamase superfamily)
MKAAATARRILLGLAGAAGLLAAGIVGLGYALSRATWRGARSDHFDGRRFFTPGAPRLEAHFSKLLRFLATRKPERWPRFREEPSGPRPPTRVPDGALRVTFVNHATVLVQMDGVNLLTDPIWSKRASPFRWAGPARVRPPGIRFEVLPPIHAIVISHNHYDHLDLATLARLRRAHPDARIFAGLGIGRLLGSEGIRGVTELDWGQTAEIGGVSLTAVPAQHFSGRGMFDSNGTLWCAWVIGGPGGRVYFAGDTGYGPHFAKTGGELGPFRLAILPIGAYRPAWFMGPVHENPAQAVAAMKDLRARRAIGIHFGTFQLTDEGISRPVEELEAALAKENPRPDFRVLGFGEGWDVPPGPGRDAGRPSGEGVVSGA